MENGKTIVDTSYTAEDMQQLMDNMKKYLAYNMQKIESPNEKVCCCCKEKLPSYEFYNSSQSSDGLNSYCVYCFNNLKKLRKELARKNKKPCADCHCEMPYGSTYCGECWKKRRKIGEKKYIQTLLSSSTGIDRELITDEMVDAKRQILKAKRIIRGYESGKD